MNTPHTILKTVALQLHYAVLTRAADFSD